MKSKVHCRLDSLTSLDAVPGISHLLPLNRLKRYLIVLAALAFAALVSSNSARANIPGGGTGSGPNVTVVTSTNGTVTMSNGVCSITLVENNAHVSSVIYTTGTHNVQMLDASNQWYYGGFMLGNGSFTYNLAVDPASNGGDYADLQEVSTTASNGVMTSDWIMLRGSPGFYTSASMSHRSQDVAFGFGAWGLITRVPGQFNWISQDTARNAYWGVQPTTSQGECLNSPHEISVNKDGTDQCEFADKFIWGMDHKDLTAWGWSSVGAGNLNVGDWLITNLQFSDGGPLKRDVFAYLYNNQNNSMDTGEVGMGSDGNLAAGEIWNKTMGPWFMYFNSTSTTGTAAAANALFTDAKNQATAEAGAWPYSWFNQQGYVGASGRGTVKGTLNEVNPNDRNITIAGTWVGLYQQPITSTSTYDFQKWLKPYQYWTTTDSGGNFTIPNVIAGSNYTLWAYSPGMPGTFMSQNQTGGNPPILYTEPSPTFSVAVTAGGTNNLGTINWTSPVVGPTVFELGYPDRKADKFRHGEDFWEPEATPELGYPTPVWGCQMRFPLEYPNGMVYNVGTSQWARDWNYVVPSDPTVTGSYQAPTATINFNLATTPTNNATASVYIGIAQVDTYDLIVSVNGVNLGSASGVTATPNAITASGFNPPYSDDSSIHFSNHGPFSDERITFPASLLHSGSNSLTIQQTYKNLVGSLMIDYLRMELTGYVPPPPTGVATEDGNSRNMLSWNAVPGATRYVISRSTTSGSGYSVITSGYLTNPAGGSGQLVYYVDSSATNGKEYYYVVQSYSPYGTSAYSAQVSGESQSGYYSTPPATPTGMTVTSTGDNSISLSWNSDGGTSFWNLYRTTLASDNVGDAIPLRTILLDNSIPPGTTTYTDTTVSNGEEYSYYVVAVDPEGSSSPSSSVTGMALPPVPSSAPSGFSAVATSGSNVNLTWSPVAGAEGYDVYRSTTSGSFTWPADFVAVMVEDSFSDSKVSPGVEYYYRVTPVNVAGIGPSSTTSVTTP